uniref:hypothetical protein n=1 Tax=Candidatus Similichlamydia epinepheli TaxID=1903953 RepID=UPI00195A3E37
VIALFAVASFFSHLSSFCTFSLVMILVWAIVYLLLDLLKSLSHIWRCVLEDLMLCLNMLMTLWFIGFVTIPIFPS